MFEQILNQSNLHIYTLIKIKKVIWKQGIVQNFDLNFNLMDLKKI